MVEVFGTNEDYKAKLWRLIDPDARSDVYVFYSGHSAPGGNDGDESFLLPVDGDASRPSLSGYPLSQLYKSLGLLKTKSTTVFLDASFSGPNSEAKLGNVNVFAAARYTQLANWDLAGC